MGIERRMVACLQEETHLSGAMQVGRIETVEDEQLGRHDAEKPEADRASSHERATRVQWGAISIDPDAVRAMRLGR
ncbi:hypothetical protein Amme_075_023 [Acidomonas methanolica NBRC 104435]|uniref:Uncharacterized protein n=1 Tax=Acidomonas methanolica NBRC 104435 TaxID=1231351 RepID=A0A023D7G4_ACIMT|nr:hypothetical protein Amme_075_023 [Acidomonas methanolica NBRC 104435]GEL00250.1 hypothetical protein AME01nite_27480 [Acidomonas methanolica NBRC 104435]